MIIEGKNVLLRPITYDDTECIVRWRNKETVRSYFIYRATLTKEDHEKWLEEKVRTENVYQFVIVDKESNISIGTVYLRDIDRDNKKCEFGIFIGEDCFLGKGLGTESAQMVTRFAFEQLDMNKVFLRLLAENERAYKSYLKAGFQVEGLARQDVYIGGQFHDVVFMSMLRGEL